MPLLLRLIRSRSSEILKINNLYNHHDSVNCCGWHPSDPWIQIISPALRDRIYNRENFCCKHCAWLWRSCKTKKVSPHVTATRAAYSMQLVVSFCSSTLSIVQNEDNCSVFCWHARLMDKNNDSNGFFSHNSYAFSISSWPLIPHQKIFEYLTSYLLCLFICWFLARTVRLSPCYSTKNAKFGSNKASRKHFMTHIVHRIE